MTDQEKIKAYEEAVEEFKNMDVDDENMVPFFRETMWRSLRDSILTKLDEKLKGV